jgi:hypothetical protein
MFAFFKKKAKEVLKLVHKPTYYFKPELKRNEVAGYYVDHFWAHNEIIKWAMDKNDVTIEFTGDMFVMHHPSHAVPAFNEFGVVINDDTTAVEFALTFGWPSSSTKSWRVVTKY